MLQCRIRHCRSSALVSSAFPPVPRRPSLASLVASGDVAPTHLLCTGGVAWVGTADARWRPETDGDGHEPGGASALPALGVTKLDRWLDTHAVRPFALATPDALHGERRVLISAAGALGWRPPLELLAAGGAGGRERRALRSAALRLRTLADATEQHAIDAVMRYTHAAATAARIARLLDAPALDTVGVAPGLFVAVDALAGTALRTLAEADALAERAFGRGRLGAPATVRAVLAEVRAAHAAPAAARRRALGLRAAAGLGPPSVRVRRLPVMDSEVWAVRVAVGAPGFASADALEAAWELATAVWHALALVAYAVAGAWTFD